MNAFQKFLYRFRRYWPETRWKKYVAETADSIPTPFLEKAVKLLKHKDVALDVGAGGLRDSRYLLNQGFKKVVALDGEPSIIIIARDIFDRRLKLAVKTFDRFWFRWSAYDLVNAQFSLFFAGPKKIEHLMKRIKRSLKPQGIFCGVLLGMKDSWRESGLERSFKAFHSEEEVRAFLVDMDILEWKEEEYDRPSFDGSAHHWHFYRFIARKK